MSRIADLRIRRSLKPVEPLTDLEMAAKYNDRCKRVGKTRRKAAKRPG